jgi:hypothetical protein
MPTPKRKKRILLHMRSIVSKLCKDLEIDPNTKRAVLRRLHHEGPSFCTKILPQFSKYVLACVEKSTLLDAREFGLTHFELKAGAPLFMRGYLLGAIAGNPASLFQIRQLCDYFYKTAFKMTAVQEEKAMQTYLGTEAEIGLESDDSIDWNFVERCRKTFERFFPELTRVDLSAAFEHNRPRNSPGAFVGSERLRFSNIKHYEVYKKLPVSNVYPHTLPGLQGYFKPYQSAPVRPQSKKLERICEIRFVPKDSRGPRTISKEEHGAIQGQMAFNDFLTQFLERKSSGRILFSDQSVHRELARKSSIDRAYSTLDLKEASDRVRLSIVSYITQNSPVFRQATRTLRAESFIIGNQKQKLRKYANMGSGLCFPTLALIIYVAAITSLTDVRKVSKAEANSVFVYGDDIICRTTDFVSVVRGLEKVGLKINPTKSFSHGFFRESCGGDYFKGVSVAPVRLKLANEGLPTIKDCRNSVLPVETDLGVISLERHCRELVDQGFQNLASYYYDQVSRRIGNLPFVGRTSPALGRYDPSREVADEDITAFVPVPIKVRNDTVCPYKGIGASISSPGGLGEDWCLTPLRRQVRLARRVVCGSVNKGYGLTSPLP